MSKKEIREQLKDQPELGRKIERAANAEEMKKLLSEAGIDVSEAQLKDMVALKAEALSDSQLRNVSGGVLGFEEEADDGHERRCFAYYHFETD